MHIEIIFDPAKDEANQRDRGVSLALAREIDWPRVMSYADDRHDYGEVREIGYVPIAGRLCCVVFTQRNAAMRIISLRKANNREVERYEQQIEALQEHTRRGSRDPAGDRRGPGHVRPFRRTVRKDETAGPATS
jgi:uncharacterized DUF497 family protein